MTVPKLIGTVLKFKGFLRALLSLGQFAHHSIRQGSNRYNASIF